MKHTICGFSQEYALTLRKTVERDGKNVEIRMDCTDLVILRWFVDFYPTMSKIIEDGREYAFLSHDYLLEQMPILGITKKATIARMKKLVELGVLSYKLINNNTSQYGFGEKYDALVRKNSPTVEGDLYPVEGIPPIPSTDHHLSPQPSTINNTIINSSISDSSYIPPMCPPVKIVRHYYGEYRNVLLSDPEMEKLQNEFPDDWQERIERLSSYMASTGKKYTNFLATIRNWAKKDAERNGKQSADGWDYIQAVAEGRAE